MNLIDEYANQLDVNSYFKKFKADDLIDFMVCLAISDYKNENIWNSFISHTNSQTLSLQNHQNFKIINQHIQSCSELSNSLKKYISHL